jgi:hypothetical protein
MQRTTQEGDFSMDAPEYYTLRLEHTIQHTQQSTNLLYLVDGAILAMLYLVTKLQDFSFQQRLVAIIVGTLAIVNILHAALIIIQGKWYSNIDKALEASIPGLKPIEEPTGAPWFRSHTLFAGVHVILGVLLTLACIIIYQLPAGTLKMLSSPGQ